MEETKNFDENLQWRKDIYKELSTEWNKGHLIIHVRRDYLLGDSVSCVMNISQTDLRKEWRFEFIGEDGAHAGGLAKQEWFKLITEELFLTPILAFSQLSLQRKNYCKDLNSLCKWLPLVSEWNKNLNSPL